MGVQGYRVYINNQTDSPKGSYTVIGDFDNGPFAVTGDTNTTYNFDPGTIGGFDMGDTIVFAVTAVSLQGAESAISNTDSVMLP